jgi:hypothetical protein
MSGDCRESLVDKDSMAFAYLYAYVNDILPEHCRDKACTYRSVAKEIEQNSTTAKQKNNDNINSSGSNESSAALTSKVDVKISNNARASSPSSQQNGTYKNWGPALRSRKRTQPDTL